MTPTRIALAQSVPRGGQSGFVSAVLLGKLFLALMMLGAGAFSVTLLAQDSAPNFETEAAKASAARESGRIKEAVQAYQAAVEAKPDWDEGWWYLGTLSYDADRFAQAIPALHRFVELDPTVGAGWAFLGLSEFETAAYDDAFTHLQRAQTLGFADDPNVEKVAIYHLALLLNRRGAFEESTRLLVTTFGQGHLPDQIKAALALALLRVPLLPSQIDPAHDALLHAAGNVGEFLAHQNMDDAIRGFEQMLKDFPSTPYLHYAFGMALLAQSRFEPAEAQFREEARTTPDSALYQVGLSSSNLKRGQVDVAVANARNAVKLDPESAYAYQALAQALQQSQKNDQAAAALEQAQRIANRPVKLDPMQAKFYALNESAKSQKSSPKITEVQPQSGESGASQSFDVLVRQANAAREANQVPEATARYQRAVELNSNYQDGWRQLGTLLYMQQNYSEAAAALKHSVSMESKQADTWTLLGLCEFELKDYKNSLLHLKKAQALGFGGNAGGIRYARYHLALLLNLEGEFDAATDLLIPEARPGALFDEIQFAMGLALLRIPNLPNNVEPSKQDLVRAAGQAAVLLSQSRYDSAFPIFEKLLRQYPDTPFLHYAYGDALSATSDYDRALIQLREEAQRNPKALVVYLRLTALALRLNQADAAQDSAKTAVALSPDSPDAHYLLGRSYLEAGDIPASIRELEIARGLAPGSPSVHFNLARAYAKANREGDAKKEREEFQRLNAQLSTQPSGRHSSDDRVGPTAESGEALAPPIAK